MKDNSPVYWKMRNGRLISVDDMDINHLRNVLKMIIRNNYRVQVVCYYCGQRLDQEAPDYIREKKINWDLFPEGFLDHPIHLQHSHYTGYTEGAVQGVLERKTMFLQHK